MNTAVRRSPLERMRLYLLLMRVHRPIGVLLLLWPALWALWIAGNGRPDAYVLFVFVAGTFLTRSAGCVVNDFADRKLDPHVSRTHDRPIASGSVSIREAWILFTALMLLAFFLVLTLNRLTVMLAVAAVAIMMIYPFLKRFTNLPQFFLGIAFSWSIPMAWAALTGTVPITAWLLFVAAGLWTVVYDTMYAMTDRDDDLVAGIKSTAILFGRQDRKIVGLLQVLTLALLWIAGRQFGLGAPYVAGLVVGAGFFLYQQHLIRNRDPAACFKAFLNNNWFGLAVFAGILLDFTVPG